MTESQQKGAEPPLVGGGGVGVGVRCKEGELRAWAGRTALELRELTGERPSVTWAAGGAVRVSVRVREMHEWDLAAAVLVALARGERYGHRRVGRWECVWTEAGGAAPAGGES